MGQLIRGKLGGAQISKDDWDRIRPLRSEFSCRTKFCSNVQMFKFYYQYGSCFQAIKIYLIKPSMCIKVLIIKKTEIQGMVVLHIYKKKNTLMNRKLNTKVN